MSITPMERTVLLNHAIIPKDIHVMNDRDIKFFVDEDNMFEGYVGVTAHSNGNRMLNIGINSVSYDENATGINAYKKWAFTQVSLITGITPDSLTGFIPSIINLAGSIITYKPAATVHAIVNGGISSAERASSESDDFKYIGEYAFCVKEPDKEVSITEDGTYENIKNVGGMSAGFDHHSVYVSLDSKNPEYNDDAYLRVHHVDDDTKVITSNASLYLVTCFDPTAGLHVANKQYVDNKVDNKYASGTYTCKAGDGGSVVYVEHPKNKVPKMVYAQISNATNSSNTDLKSADPVTTFVFASVPLENGELSTNKIALLIPDIDNITGTEISWCIYLD